MKAIDIVAAVLLILGGINWGLLGLTGLNVIASIFGFAPIITTIIYILVGVAALYQIVPLSRQLQAGIA